MSVTYTDLHWRIQKTLWKQEIKHKNQFLPLKSLEYSASWTKQTAFISQPATFLAD